MQRNHLLIAEYIYKVQLRPIFAHVVIYDILAITN